MSERVRIKLFRNWLDNANSIDIVAIRRHSLDPICVRLWGRSRTANCHLREQYDIRNGKMTIERLNVYIQGLWSREAKAMIPIEVREVTTIGIWRWIEWDEEIRPVEAGANRWARTDVVDVWDRIKMTIDQSWPKTWVKRNSSRRILDLFSAVNRRGENRNIWAWSPFRRGWSHYIPS